jgi:hypothetical protein
MAELRLLSGSCVSLVIMSLLTPNTGNYSYTLSEEEEAYHNMLGSINAIISNNDQIIAQNMLDTCLRVTSRGGKTKKVNARRACTILDSASPPEDQFQGLYPVLLYTLRLLTLTYSSC